jgi:hypothetical protein
MAEWAKGESPIYPELFKRRIGREFLVSTLVHFEFNGVLFSRHHMECGITSETCTEEMIIDRIIQSAEQCKKLAVPCEIDDVVKVLVQYAKNK